MGAQSNSDRKSGRGMLTFEEVSVTRERLRKRYLPDRVRILFVGESPPASGRFFYQADSGLYWALRETFLTAFPLLKKTDFLNSFRSLGCYLVDVCGEPVDKLDSHARRSACRVAEGHLVRTIRKLRPKVIVTVVRSIRGNVIRAQQQAGWTGPHLELPYPGRWSRHRTEFRRSLVPLLRRSLSVFNLRKSLSSPNVSHLPVPPISPRVRGKRGKPGFRVLKKMRAGKAI